MRKALLLVLLLETMVAEADLYMDGLSRFIYGCI